MDSEFMMTFFVIIARINKSIISISEIENISILCTDIQLLFCEIGQKGNIKEKEYTYIRWKKKLKKKTDITDIINV